MYDTNKGFIICTLPILRKRKEVINLYRKFELLKLKNIFILYKW